MVFLTSSVAKKSKRAALLTMALHFSRSSGGGRPTSCSRGHVLHQCIDTGKIIPIGSMVLLYMVTFTINIPQMLAYIYIYHTWILCCHVAISLMTYTGYTPVLY